jgi:transcriptional regulator with XRE-family HTH domain
MTLAEKIVYFRNRKGWTPAELCEASGVSRPYLWQLETGGKDRPSLEVLEKLAKALGISVAEFAAESARENPRGNSPLPPSLAQFVRENSTKYGLRKSDIEMLQGVHYHGSQPTTPEDWDLLYNCIRKICG